MKNLILGTSATTFSPDTVSTRAMVVTLLYRMAGNPEVESNNSFVDVSPEDWFYKAVLWANAKGIVNGYDSEHFGPNDNITREQFATILYRYAKMLYPEMKYEYYSHPYGAYIKPDAYSEEYYKNLDLSFDKTAAENKVSDYAIDPMLLATGFGVIRLKDYRLAPKEAVTRADLAIGMAAMNIIVLPELERNPILH